MITSDQIRAARALLNWSQTELSVRSSLTTPTIANIELGKQTPSTTTLQRIYDAFDIAGIEFTDGDGVKKRIGQTYTYRGHNGFEKFYQDIDATALAMPNGEFLVSNVNEHDFLKWLSEENIYRHHLAITRTSVKYRILIKEGDDYMPGSSFGAIYHWTAGDQFHSVPYYVYGNKVAYIAFEENDVNVFVVENALLSQLHRRQFDEMWGRSIAPKILHTKNTESLPKKTLSGTKKSSSAKKTENIKTSQIKKRSKPT